VFFLPFGTLCLTISLNSVCVVFLRSYGKYRLAPNGKSWSSFGSDSANENPGVLKRRCSSNTPLLWVLGFTPRPISCVMQSDCYYLRGAFLNRTGSSFSLRLGGGRLAPNRPVVRLGPLYSTGGVVWFSLIRPWGRRPPRPSPVLDYRRSHQNVYSDELQQSNKESSVGLIAVLASLGKRLPEMEFAALMPWFSASVSMGFAIGRRRVKNKRHLVLVLDWSSRSSFSRLPQAAGLVVVVATTKRVLSFGCCEK